MSANNVSVASNAVDNVSFFLRSFKLLKKFALNFHAVLWKAIISTGDLVSVH